MCSDALVVFTNHHKGRRKGQVNVLVSLEKLLQNRALWPAHTIVGGASGLHRTVQGAGRLEVPDFTPDRHPHELLFTTGYFLATHDAKTQRALIHRLCRHDIPGLVLKTHRYLPSFPEPMRDAADQCQFPLIEVGPQTNLNRLIQEIVRFISAPKHPIPPWWSDWHRHVMAEESFTALAGFLENASNVRLALVDGEGYVYPSPAIPVARQSFSEKWTLRPHPVHHPAWARMSHGSEICEGFAVELHTVVPSRLLVYTERRSSGELTGYLEFWQSILPFLQLLGKLAVNQFWSLRKEISDAWTSRVDDDATTLARWGMDPMTPKQWIAVSCPSARAQAWTAAESYRMRHHLSGITIATDSGIAMLGHAPLPAPDDILALFPLEARIVLSPVFYDVAAARRHYNLVLAASTTSGDRRQRVIDYSSDLVFSLLDYIPPEVAETFVQHVLGPLVESGPSRRDLLDTLGIFFETNSLKDTAKRLHVHYNTVVYRLEQLEHVLSRDIQNYHQRLELLLATLLWKKTRDVKGDRP